MGWANKALEKHKIEKAIEEALKSPKYKKMEEENKVQTTLDAYCRFCLMACDYLQMKHNYKKNGLMNFLEYASKIMKHISNEDEDFENYFSEINQVMIDECGIDVLSTLGCGFVKDGANNE